MGFFVLESWAFYNSGVHVDLLTGIAHQGCLFTATNTEIKGSTRTNRIVSTLVNRRRLLYTQTNDELPSSFYGDSRLELLQKGASKGRRRRKGSTRRKNRRQTKSQTVRAIVPHSGRHFFPSHPAYRRSFARRLFSKLRKRKRFMEGWYYRLTLKDYQIDGCTDSSSNKMPVSFAFIISIEDPGIASSDLKLACLQAIGPNDQYLVQSTKDDSRFWASKNTQSLGCTFEEEIDNTIDVGRSSPTEIDASLWNETVRSGFQIIDHSSRKPSEVSDSNRKPRWMGRISGHDGSKGGVLDGQGVEGKVEFDFEVEPDSICGYGGYTTSTSSRHATTVHKDNNSTRREISGEIQKLENRVAKRQKSTGGWLSSFPVFEPHWQVTIADALASGSVDWNGTQYRFQNQPFYAEKNWGDALPSKWYWTQCNSFDNHDGQLSVTAGGGIRKLPFGREEELGMIAVHHEGRFYEAVPWKGNVEWNVSTWGEWSLYGDRLEETTSYGLDDTTLPTTTPSFAVELRYSCDPVNLPGLVFRAPTPKQGMVPFCRDTFEADCELTLWELRKNETTNNFEKVEPPIINKAKSREGGAEIGGGPWWSEWRGKSELKPVVKALLNFPKNVRYR